MGLLANVIKEVSRAGKLPVCANETCSARRWKLWGRRANGVRLNSSWYCSDSCAQTAITVLLAGAPRFTAEAAPSAHRLPLGLLMLSRGVIDEAQLKAAVAAQAERPEIKIGKYLETMGAVTTGDVTRALGAQHCVPVLVALEAELEDDVPLCLLESSRCVVYRGNFHAGLLYVGFESKVDRSVLSAMEMMLGSQCEPCIVESQVVDQYLEARRRACSADEITFEAHFSTAELVRSISSYAQQVRAEEIRISSTRQYVWARVSGWREVDLMFRLH